MVAAVSVLPPPRAYLIRAHDAERMYHLVNF